MIARSLPFDTLQTILLTLPTKHLLGAQLLAQNIQGIPISSTDLMAATTELVIYQKDCVQLMSRLIDLPPTPSTQSLLDYGL